MTVSWYTHIRVPQHHHRMHLIAAIQEASSTVVVGLHSCAVNGHVDEVEGGIRFTCTIHVAHLFWQHLLSNQLSVFSMLH